MTRPHCLPAHNSYYSNSFIIRLSIYIPGMSYYSDLSQEESVHVHVHVPDAYIIVGAQKYKSSHYTGIVLSLSL